MNTPGSVPPSVSGPAPGTALERARQVAARVPDPELPMLTLAELGILRGVALDAVGTVTVRLTPTYCGCPALAEMRAEVARRLRAAGFARVDIRTELHPPWTSDWITPAGRRALARHGIAPPGPAPGPVPLALTAPRRATVPCPRCGSPDTEELSRFSATACRALRRCGACREPFEHVKEL